jgi:hypothetical protein
MLLKNGECGDSMLETIEERVKLIKMGVDGKKIEKLYIEHNNLKIINSPILYESKKENNMRK